MRLSQHQEREIEKEKERLRLEFEKRRDNEIKALQDILNKAERWHKSNNLRNYIDKVESKANENGNTGDITKWLLWARDKADWYDPFVEKEDEVLEGVDRDGLVVKKDVRNGW